MRHKKKYKIKPRFFVILAVLVGLIAGGILYFNFHSDSKAENDEKSAQLDQGYQIMLASRMYICNKDLRYDDQYYAGGYPPEDIGVCTDVVWKGFRGIGVNLKNMVDKDIAENIEAYSDVISVPDPNIDFRLVPRLEVFFQRNAEVLTTDVDNLLAWQPGDIVTFESSHVAIVSSIRNIWGRPYIIQHGKDPAAEEDRIFASDGMEISGHFRWPLVKKLN
ncbi:Uncharacterized protein conserved in bacteria [uncultured Eubacterium sp.]|nr:Uncharacterized protein conserved in bacteria [uncultured Eubacterium sp.]